MVVCNTQQYTYTFFISLVELRFGFLTVGEGLVRERCETVHGHPLLPTELRIQVVKIEKSMKHPRYTYHVEEGGYTAWDANCCRPIS